MRIIMLYTTQLREKYRLNEYFQAENLRHTDDNDNDVKYLHIIPRFLANLVKFHGEIRSSVVPQLSEYV
jgi:hypothetical protein